MRRVRRRGVAATVAACAAAAVCGDLTVQADTPAPQFSTVLLSGDVVPGAGAVSSLLTVSSAYLAEDGTKLLWGHARVPQGGGYDVYSALYILSPAGAVEQAMRSGAAFPPEGAGPEWALGLGSWAAGGPGLFAVHPTMRAAGPVDHHEAWVGRPGAWVRVAREGEELAGTAGAKVAEPYAVAFNPAGDVLASVRTQGSQTGLWAGKAGAPLSKVMLEDDLAPGAPARYVFTAFDWPSARAMNASGLVAFSASLFRDAPDPDSLEGIWVWDAAGGTRLAVFDGEGMIRGSTYSVGGVTDAGEVAFVGHGTAAAGGRYGAWLARLGGASRPLLVDGDAVPEAGDGATVSAIGGVVIHPSGAAAVRGSVADRPYDPVRGHPPALWAGAAGELKFVTEGWRQAPGALAGSEFENFEPTMVNARGQVLFSSLLSGDPLGLGTTVHPSLWVTDAEGSLVLLAEQGGYLDVDDGPGVELRRVLALLEKAWLAESGDVLFSVQFTDGSTGVFQVTTVPEPMGAAVAGLLAGAWMLRRRRRPSAR